MRAELSCIITVGYNPKKTLYEYLQTPLRFAKPKPCSHLTTYLENVKVLTLIISFAPLPMSNTLNL